jgi:hypothetical protein
VVVHIEVRRPYEIFSGPPGAEKQTLYSEDRILSGTFEVVAKPPSDLLTAIDDATLTPQIEACLTPLEFTFGRNIKNRLAGQIQIRNAPVNLSLRLFARYNDRDHPMSAITCAAGKGSNYYVVGDNIKDPPPAKIDLILRTDEQAARQTIDQTNVWKGEIVIKDVEVKPATK